MDKDVLIAAIGALALVVVALLSYVVPALVSTRKHARNASQSAARADEQVSNGHTTNLREEGDTRHDAVMREIGKVLGLVATIEQRLSIVEETVPRASIHKPRNYGPKGNQ